MVHKFLSYSKSHIYELHALLAAMVAFLIMLVVKKPIKKWIDSYVDKKAQSNSKWNDNKALYRKRLNLILIICTIIVSMLVYNLLTHISPLIQFSSVTTFLSAVFALDIYAVYDQLRGDNNE